MNGIITFKCDFFICTEPTTPPPEATTPPTEATSTLHNDGNYDDFVGKLERF